MSLTSLVLTVRPRAQTQLPSALGRAAHAALLQAMHAVDPALAHALHGDPGPRPFTCSSLLGKRRAGAVLPDQQYTLRYTALTAAIAEAFDAIFAADGGAYAPGREIELDGAPFVVHGATMDSTVHPWAGRTTYPDLSGRWLLARDLPAARLTLHFAAPTAFRAGGMAQMLPLPEWVFGSLLDKWNAFAPVSLPPETRRFAAECLAVSRLQLSSHAAPFKSDGAVKFGAVGKVTYVALNRDRYWLSLINLLAEYAQFAGVGMSTAMGMGQCRVLAMDAGAPGKASVENQKWENASALRD